MLKMIISTWVLGQCRPDELRPVDLWIPSHQPQTVCQPRPQPTTQPCRGWREEGHVGACRRVDLEVRPKCHASLSLSYLVSPWSTCEFWDQTWHTMCCIHSLFEPPTPLLEQLLQHDIHHFAVPETEKN